MDFDPLKQRFQALEVGASVLLAEREPKQGVEDAAYRRDGAENFLTLVRDLKRNRTKE